LPFLFAARSQRANDPRRCRIASGQLSLPRKSSAFSSRPEHNINHHIGSSQRLSAPRSANAFVFVSSRKPNRVSGADTTFEPDGAADLWTARKYPERTCRSRRASEISPGARVGAESWALAPSAACQRSGGVDASSGVRRVLGLGPRDRASWSASPKGSAGSWVAAGAGPRHSRRARQGGQACGPPNRGSSRLAAETAFARGRDAASRAAPWMECGYRDGFVTSAVDLVSRPDWLCRARRRLHCVQDGLSVRERPAVARNPTTLRPSWLWFQI